MLYFFFFAHILPSLIFSHPKFESQLILLSSFLQDNALLTFCHLYTEECLSAYIHVIPTSLIFRELPEMNYKISSKTYHFLPKF